jgi:hypothetical protein
LPGPVTSMTGPHDRSSMTALMNESCRFVLPTDPISASELDFQGMERQMHAYKFLVQNSSYGIVRGIVLICHVRMHNVSRC